jgi:hypothetical protein
MLPVRDDVKLNQRCTASERLTAVSSRLQHPSARSGLPMIGLRIGAPSRMAVRLPDT